MYSEVKEEVRIAAEDDWQCGCLLSTKEASYPQAISSCLRLIFAAPSCQCFLWHCFSLVSMPHLPPTRS